MTRDDHVGGNVDYWTRINEGFTDERASEQWDTEDIRWGVFGTADDTLGSPLGDVDGLDVIELGCGTAYLGAWLAKRGARVVGIDPTPAQLATARRQQERTGIRYPLHEATAEAVPLQDDSYELSVSEYGASLWADPAGWIPETARLLRPGGRLVFLTNSVQVYLSAPDAGMVTERLERPQFGIYSVTWPCETGTEFHLAHGDWIRLLRCHGLEVEELIEMQAPADAETHGYYDFVSATWARQWPAEEIWVVRLRE